MFFLVVLFGGVPFDIDSYRSISRSRVVGHRCNYIRGVYLKEELTNNGLDPFNSFVIVETVSIADRLTVVGFMHVCKKHFPDDDFSITDLGYNEDAIAMYLANDGVLGDQEEDTTGYIDNSDVLAMDLIGKESPVYDDDVEDE